MTNRVRPRGADAIMLDLEDAIPAAQKTSARKLVKDALPLAARGGAEVMVRINDAPGLLDADVDAAVYRGLDGLTLPKAESAEQIRSLDASIGRLECGRGIAPGHVKLSLIAETPRGLLNVEAIAAACPRVVTMSVGSEDYCLELGVELSADGFELQYPVARLVTVCKALGIQATGILGTIAEFRDLAAFEAAAVRARQLGCDGAGCIHPDQVAVLNRVFTPEPAKIEHARAIAELERRKTEALARLAWELLS